MSSIPKVVIVGRMNVGKSSLFNRLSNSVKSMTLDYEGVTRDVVVDRVAWLDRTFDLVDTGGITKRGSDALLEVVRERALGFIDEADLILFVVDGVSSITAEDEEISRELRRRGKKVLLLVNKSDAKIAQEQLHDFYRLYQQQILPISALHGLGIADLLEEIVKNLPTKGSDAVEDKPAYRVALIGRPNVGKSSLMNSLVQEERSIVSPIAGTTREAVSSHISFYRESLELIDTPGIRRQSAVHEELETLMVKSSLRTIKDADIVVLLIDASQTGGIVDQELKLAFYAFNDLYKALIMVVNKVDLLTEELRADLENKFAQYPQLMNKIDLIRISCKTGKNVGRVLPTVKEVWERYSMRLPKDELSRILIDAFERVPVTRNQQRLRIHSVEQVAVTPISIKIKVNYPKFFESAQRSYLDKVLRTHFDLIGVPIKFIIV